MATAFSSPSEIFLANVWTRRLWIPLIFGRSLMILMIQRIEKTVKDLSHSIISILTVFWQYNCKASRKMHVWTTSPCRPSTWAIWNRISYSPTEKAKLNSIKTPYPLILMVLGCSGSNTAIKTHANCICTTSKGRSRYSSTLSAKMMEWFHMSSLWRRRKEVARR